MENGDIYIEYLDRRKRTKDRHLGENFGEKRLEVVEVGEILERKAWQKEWKMERYMGEERMKN